MSYCEIVKLIILCNLLSHGKLINFDNIYSIFDPRVVSNVTSVKLDINVNLLFIAIKGQKKSGVQCKFI